MSKRGRDISHQKHSAQWPTSGRDFTNTEFLLDEQEAGSLHEASQSLGHVPEG